MAQGYETLTIESTENKSAEILYLATPHSDSKHERLDDWSFPGTRNSNCDMDLGIGIPPSAGLTGFEHDVGFQGGESFLESISTIPFTPSYDLDSFSATFEDPFPYQTEPFSMFEPTLAEPNTNKEYPGTRGPKDEKPDNKLLSFKPFALGHALFTSAGAQTWPSMTAELNGMFFVAEDVFGDNIPTPGRPTELTCYRRNLFQISGNITLSRDIKTVITEQGLQLPIIDLSATLTAVESIDGKMTEIISVPWKSTAQSAASLSAEDKTGSTPQRIPIDLSSNPEHDPAVVSIPIAWKRLQFKHATANNGRRKGLQQHYIVHISLAGVLGNGETVNLAEICSGPVIVRGRSPRNFDSRKDISLSSERKIDSKPKAGEVNKEPILKVDPGVINGSYKFYSMSTVQTPLDLNDWNTPTPAPPHPSASTSNDSHKAKKPSLRHNSSSSVSNAPQRPPIPQTQWRSNSATSKHGSSSSGVDVTSKQRMAPIDLSIGDEEEARAAFSGSGRHLSLGEGSPRVTRTGSSGAASNGLSLPKKAVGSPIEDADLLYEYFPLSLDDWMPPVDAIYRPHVVHHTVIPPDLKAEQVRNKTKRYFSADE